MRLAHKVCLGHRRCADVAWQYVWFAPKPPVPSDEGERDLRRSPPESSVERDRRLFPSASTGRRTQTKYEIDGVPGPPESIAIPLSFGSGRRSPIGRGEGGYAVDALPNLDAIEAV